MPAHSLSKQASSISWEVVLLEECPPEQCDLIKVLPQYPVCFCVSKMLLKNLNFFYFFTSN